MPLYLGTENAGTQRYSLQDFEPSWGSKMNAAVREAWLESYGPVAKDWVSRLLAGQEGERLTAADAEAVIKQAGVKINLTPRDGQYTRTQLDLLLERQRELAAVKDVRERTPWGLGSVARGVAMFGAGILDPLNFATALVPWTRAITALNGIRAATMAESFATRTAARAALGGADAGISTAAIEPFYYGMRRALGDDYTALDSMANIAFGTAFGGGIHGIGGAIGDYVRIRYGRETPWQKYAGLNVQQIRQVHEYFDLMREGGEASARAAQMAESFTPGMRRAAGIADPGETMASAAGPAAPERIETDFARFYDETERAQAFDERIATLEERLSTLIAESSQLAARGDIRAARRELASLTRPDDSETASRALAKQIQENERVSYKQALSQAKKQIADAVADFDARVARLNETIALNSEAQKKANQIRSVMEELEMLREGRSELDFPLVRENPLAASIRRIGRTEIPARFAIHRLDPETREATLRTAVAQMADGREVDVDTIIGMDPSRQTATIDDVMAAADRNFEPESQPLADFEASARVDERVKSAPKWEGLADAEQAAADADATLNDVIATADEAYKYARGDETAAEARASVEALRDAVTRSFGDATDAMLEAGRIRIVETPDQIPGGPHPGDVKAATMPDGTVYMVASNVTDAEARGLVLHEVGVHVGMEEMLGPDVYRSVLDQLDSAIARGEDWAHRARAAVPDGTAPGLVREEQLAYLVQNAPELGIVKQIIAAVRAWAYRTFQFARDRMTLTEADFRALAVSALRAAAKWGDAGRFAEAGAYARPGGAADQFRAFLTLNRPYVEKGLLARLASQPFDYEIREVPLDSIRLTQTGEDYLNSSSRYTAEQIRLGTAAERRPEDVFPVLLSEDGTLLDGHHRHAAATINQEGSILALVPARPGHGRVLNLDDFVVTQTPDAPAFARDVAQTETKAFRDWFGDSKVVDDNGKPLVVYHGTNADFSVFNVDGNWDDEVGAFFTTDPEEASSYGSGSGANVKPAYLSIANPYSVTDRQWAAGEGLSPREARGAGYDGYVIEQRNGSKHYVAFRPEQIKSAIGNRGTFDPNNPDIRYARGETPDPSNIKDELKPYDDRIARAKQYVSVLRAAADKLDNDVQATEAMRAALPDITPQEIGDLLDQLRRQVKGLRGVARSARDMIRAEDVAETLQIDAMRAADEVANNIEMAAVIEKRNAALNLAARVRATSFLNQFRGSKLDFEGFRAMLVGTERKRVGGRMSVEGEQKSFRGEWVGGLIADMERAGLMQHFTSGQFDRDVYVALYNMGRGRDLSQLPREAVEIAKIVDKYQADARNTRNRFGAWIRDLQGYIVRQSHDMFKIRDAGFEKYREAVLPLLDVNRTLRDFDGTIDDFLTRVYDDFATGSHMKTPTDDADLVAFGRGSNLARKESQSRVLYFKDGEAAFKYNQLFGTGKLAENVLHGLERSAQSAGLLKVLGTNPEATLTRLFDEYAESLRGDPERRAKFLQHRKEMQNLLAQVDGSVNIPGNAQAAKISAFFRAWQTMAKLGGMLISSVTDLANYAAELRYGQDKNLLSGVLDGIGALTRGRAKGEQAAILNQLGVFHESVLGSVYARFDNPDLIGGKTAAAMQQFFKLTGINWWTESLRDGYVLSHANYLASNASKSWDQLPASLRDMLSLYRIDAGKWDVLRVAPLQQADGRMYMTPEGLATVPDAVLENYIQQIGRTPSAVAIQNLRDDLASALRAMAIDRMNHAVIEPNARVRAFMVRGTQPGTVPGEFLRFVGQFKSFPIAMIQMSLGREVYGRGYDTLSDYLRRGRGDMLGLASFIGLTVAMGYAAMSVKDLLRGRNPRPVDDPATWAAAFVQGGGLGIYGDFLFGKFNRMGGTLSSSLVGPAGNVVDTVADLWTRIRTGDDVAAAAFKAALENTPFANLFYTRTALDYLILYRIQEALNPGFLRRMERRLENETGQTFYLPPSQVVR